MVVVQAAMVVFPDLPKLCRKQNDKLLDEVKCELELLRSGRSIGELKGLQEKVNGLVKLDQFHQWVEKRAFKGHNGPSTLKLVDWLGDQVVGFDDAVDEIAKELHLSLAEEEAVVVEEEDEIDAESTEMQVWEGDCGEEEVICTSLVEKCMVDGLTVYGEDTAERCTLSNRLDAGIQTWGEEENKYCQKAEGVFYFPKEGDDLMEYARKTLPYLRVYPVGYGGFYVPVDQIEFEYDLKKCDQELAQYFKDNMEELNVGHWGKRFKTFLDMELFWNVYHIPKLGTESDHMGLFLFWAALFQHESKCKDKLTLSKLISSERQTFLGAKKAKEMTSEMKWSLHCTFPEVEDGSNARNPIELTFQEVIWESNEFLDPDMEQPVLVDTVERMKNEYVLQKVTSKMYRLMENAFEKNVRGDKLQYVVAVGESVWDLYQTELIVGDCVWTLKWFDGLSKMGQEYTLEYFESCMSSLHDKLMDLCEAWTKEKFLEIFPGFMNAYRVMKHDMEMKEDVKDFVVYESSPMKKGKRRLKLNNGDEIQKEKRMKLELRKERKEDELETVDKQRARLLKQLKYLDSKREKLMSQMNDCDMDWCDL